ncbi:MAG: serine hydroxymethyltransferase, partial [Flavobacteriaceae bacterium]
FVTSGIRFGTPAITTRGLVEADMETVVELIDRVLQNPEDDATLEAVGAAVHQLMEGRPLFQR